MMFNVSTSPNEAFATVLLEAMSLGLPVIGLGVLFANKTILKMVIMAILYLIQL